MSLATDQRLIGAKSTASTSLAEATAVVAPIRPLSLHVNFSWILAGNLVRVVCRFGMLLLLGYFCGLAAAGRYAIAVAVCTPIWTFVMLGLRGALVTDARHEYSFVDYLAVRLIASGGGLIVVAGAILLGGYDASASAVILLVAVAKLLEGLSDILRGRLQQQERMDRIAIALWIQGVSSLALTVVVGCLGGGVTLIVAALPVAMALTLLLWDIPCCAEMARMASRERDPGVGFWRKHIRWATLGRLSVVAFPLAVVGFLLGLIPQLPKYVIASVMGDEAVAVYAIVTYGVTLGMMVVTALGNVAAPRLAKQYAAGDVRAFARLVVRMIMLVGGMGAAGLVIVGLLGTRIAVAVASLSPTVSAFLAKEGEDLPRLALALSLFAIMLYVTAPLGSALGAMRRFWSQAIIVALGLSLALAVLPWAVRTYGMIGAAEVMTLSMAVVATLTAGVVWRVLLRRVCGENESRTEAAVLVE